MKKMLRKDMKLEELTELGWEDAAGYLRERDEKYGTSALMVVASIQPQPDDGTMAPPPTIFGELMESLDIVPRISDMRQGTSRPGTSHNSPGRVNPQSNTSILGLEPPAEPNPSFFLITKPPEAGNIYPSL
jgi:hypothetical protein